MAMTGAPGTTSCKTSTRFASNKLVNWVTPVTLPPGRLRLATSPDRTGSPPVVKTTGMVAVAALATSAETMPPLVMITSTRRRTRSAARAGRRSF
jgi:hypothetical protein